MKKYQIKRVFIYFVISLIPYVLFYYPLLNKNLFLAGSDAVSNYYPTRFYLWESLKEFRFPFWTERIFSGFPIYADSERGFLNPLNIVSILLFGPMNSYKFLHLLFYLCGSMAFISFLKRKNFTLLGIFVANLVYYFSFFHLYHQKHFYIVLTTFMIPAGLLLIDKYLSSKKLRWWLFFAGLTSLLFYFGAYQAVFLFILPCFLYFFIYSWNLSKLAESLNLLLIYFLLVATLSLPQLFVSAELFKNSVRGSNSVLMTEGSFNPIMLANSVYPFLFGTGPNYKWNTISNDYYPHETYVYSGIVAGFLAFVGFVVLKDRKMKLFIFLNIIIYLILGFIKYIPLLGTIQFPLLSFFRYWGRSVVLFSFAIAYLSGYFISFPEKIKISRLLKDKFLVGTSSGFLIFCIYSYFAFEEVRRTLFVLFNGVVIRDINFYIWVVLAILGLAMLALYIFCTKKLAIGLILASLVLFDLYYFGNPIVMGFVEKYSDIVPQSSVKNIDQYRNVRILSLSDATYWNKGLYFNHWGIFGLGPYTPFKYKNYMDSLNISILKGDGMTGTEPNLALTGVKYVLNASGEVISEYSTSMLGDFLGSLESSRDSEGSFFYKINSLQPQTLHTYISNYPGWVVKVNGMEASLLKDSVFLTFPVPQGLVDVDIRFIPKILYYAYFLSFFGLVVLVVFLSGFLRVIAAFYEKEFN